MIRVSNEVEQDEIEQSDNGSEMVVRNSTGCWQSGGARCKARYVVLLAPDGSLLAFDRRSAQRPQYIGGDVLRDLDDRMALGDLDSPYNAAGYSRLAGDCADQISGPDTGAASHADVEADHVGWFITPAVLLSSAAFLWGVGLLECAALRRALVRWSFLVRPRHLSVFRFPK